MQGLGSGAITLAGTVEQQHCYLRAVATGSKIAAFALSEPGAGSDAGALSSRATRTESGWVLNGEKTWISNGGIADFYCVFAKTDPDAGTRGISAFIVEPKKYPGFEARPIEMMGLSKALRTNAVFLTDFVVPVENRLGEEGQGFTIVMQCLQAGRVTVAAKALGVARACFEDAVRYANHDAAWIHALVASGRVVLESKDAQLTSLKPA